MNAAGSSLRRVEEHLERAGSQRGQRAGSWSCPVPSHGQGRGDAHPSLSVEQRNGKAVLHCFAGCETTDVLEAIGLAARDLFDDRSEPKPRPKPKRVAVYEYLEATGAPIRRKVRFEPGLDGRPKSFRWEEPAPKGWTTASGNGNPKVLYRLPGLMAALAVGDAVYVCAGEKDADAVERAGWPATTNPEGEGPGKWRHEYTEVFRGAASEVRVLADRDRIGYAHAAAVAEALREAGVSVRCLEAATGKDAADHLGAGLMPEDFVPVDLAPREDSPAKDDTEALDSETGSPIPRRLAKGRQRNRRLNGGDDDETSAPAPRLESLDPYNMKPREWLWKSYLPAAGFVGIEGPGDVGKTFIIAEMAARIAQGRKMPDDSAGPGKGAVLWLTDEEGGEEITRRLLGAGLNPKQGDFNAICTLSVRTDGNAVELPRDLPVLREAVAGLETLSMLPVRLVVLDPLFQFLEHHVEENSAKQVRHACAPLGPIARELGVCILGLRHWNKAKLQARRDRGAGSAQFSSTFRIQLAVFRHPSDPEVRVLSNEMNRYAPDSDRVPLGFRLVSVPEFDTARVEWLGPVELDDETGAETAVDRAAYWLRRYLEDRAARGCEWTRKAQVLVVAAEEGMNRRVIERAAASLGVRSRKGFQGHATWAAPVARGETGKTGEIGERAGDSLANFASDPGPEDGSESGSRSNISNNPNISTHTLREEEEDDLGGYF